MKRANIQAFLFSFLAFTYPQVGLGVPTMIPYEDSVEGGTVVSLTVDKKGKGSATINPCPGCPNVHLKVTPETRVISGNKSLPLTSDAKLLGKQGDVFYVIEDKRLTRIKLY